MKQLQDKLTDFEKMKYFNELNRNISCAEISSAIAKIKNNKSPGLDNISNNMIKHSQAFMINCFHKSLTSVFYLENPETWSDGYITPLLKGNDPSDPNN